MGEEQKVQIINEIKQLERDLYLKKSKFASGEAMEYGITKTLPYLSAEGLNSDKWKDLFSKLIEKIGESSAGGDSVKDIHLERQR